MRPHSIPCWERPHPHRSMWHCCNVVRSTPQLPLLLLLRPLPRLLACEGTCGSLTASEPAVHSQVPLTSLDHGLLVPASGHPLVFIIFFTLQGHTHMTASWDP